MAKFFKIPKFLIWSVKILLGLVILTAISLASLVWWLSTDDGKSYIDARLQKDISEAIGYKIETKDISFSFPLNANVGELSLSDSKGIWLETSGLSISIIPTPTITQHLIISNLGIDSFTLHRKPEQTVKTSDNDGSGGGGIDVSVLNMDIGKATLKPELTGFKDDVIGSLKFSINWVADSKNLSIDVNSDIAQLIPEIKSGEISASAKYKIDTNRVELSSIKFTSPEAKISGTGYVDLNSEELNITLSSNDLKLEKFINGVNGTANAEIKIFGTFKDLMFNIAANTSNIIYKNNKIPDAKQIITANKHTDSWAGNIGISVNDSQQLLSSYTWQNSMLKLDNIAFKYGKNNASGSILLNTNNMIAEGSLKASLPDLTELSDLLPQEIKGSANVNASLSNNKGKQAAKINADLKNISAIGATASSANIETFIADVKNAKPESVAIDATGITYSGNSLQKASIQATPKGDGMDFSLSLEGAKGQPFKIISNGNATIESGESWSAKLSSLSGNYAGYMFKNLDVITLSQQSKKRSISAPKMNINNGIFSISATQNENDIEARLNGNDIILSNFKQPIPEQLQNSRAALALAISGNVKSPQLVADAKINGVKLHEKTTNGVISLKTNISNGTADVTANLEGVTALASSAQLSIPVNFSVEPFNFSMNESSALKGNVKLAMDVSTLSGLFLTPEHILKGKADGNFAIGGTIKEPLVEGELNFINGSYSLSTTGTSLQNINAKILASGKNLTLKDFQAQDLEGNPITGSGAAKINSLTDLAYQIDINLKNLTIVSQSFAKGSSSGDIKIQGDHQKGYISGALTNDLLNIYLPAQFAGVVPALAMAGSSKTPAATQKKKAEPKQSNYPISLNVSWQANNNVFVQGWGLNTELKGTLFAKGFAHDPKVEGKLNITRGNYQEFGKRFDVKQGELSFEGDIPPSPYINITTSFVQSGVEINPILTGPILSPRVKFDSPSMSPEEALSNIFLGTDSTKQNSLQKTINKGLSKITGNSDGGLGNLLGIGGGIGGGAIGGNTNSNVDDSVETDLEPQEYQDNIDMENAIDVEFDSDFSE